MGKLVEQIQETIDKSRKLGESQAAALQGVDDQTRTNLALSAWVNGLENAVVKLAREVEKRDSAAAGNAKD